MNQTNYLANEGGFYIVRPSLSDVGLWDVFRANNLEGNNELFFAQCSEQKIALRIAELLAVEGMEYPSFS